MILKKLHDKNEQKKDQEMLRRLEELSDLSPLLPLLQGISDLPDIEEQIDTLISYSENYKKYQAFIKQNLEVLIDKKCNELAKDWDTIEAYKRETALYEKISRMLAILDEDYFVENLKLHQQSFIDRDQIPNKLKKIEYDLKEVQEMLEDLNVLEHYIFNIFDSMFHITSHFDEEMYRVKLFVMISKLKGLNKGLLCDNVFNDKFNYLYQVIIKAIPLTEPLIENVCSQLPFFSDFIEEILKASKIEDTFKRNESFHKCIKEQRDILLERQYSKLKEKNELSKEDSPENYTIFNSLKCLYQEKELYEYIIYYLFQRKEEVRECILSESVDKLKRMVSCSKLEFKTKCLNKLKDISNRDQGIKKVEKSFEKKEIELHRIYEFQKRILKYFAEAKEKKQYEKFILSESRGKADKIIKKALTIFTQ